MRETPEEKLLLAENRRRMRQVDAQMDVVRAKIAPDLAELDRLTNVKGELVRENARIQCASAARIARRINERALAAKNNAPAAGDGDEGRKENENGK
jgi:hypothetical protein|nr:MAG TPA: hypothetical protein [Caudoviricetes sp.]